MTLENTIWILRKTIKKCLPDFLVDLRTNRKLAAIRRKHARLSVQQVFIDIYRRKLWGRANAHSSTFFSGAGSHDTAIVSPYVDAVQNFLSSLPVKPDVVDLGCGDFAVGSKLRSYCRTYIACDIVPDLIENNRMQFERMGVDFRLIDLSENELPKGDVVFIRQVLQHLSNDLICKAVSKIAQNYRYLILTEHLPEDRNFIPNLDKPVGPDMRLEINSGVVLTKSPFHLAVRDERVLCEAAHFGGIIRTTVYTLS
jgi:hypothetical protein